MGDPFVNLSINDLTECINNTEFKVKHDPHNSVKDEFNKFVNKEISQRRKNSSISDMRDFHNHIKRTLIQNISDIYRLKTKTQRLNCLDIAVGRGGDLFKWESSGINNVFGFDKSRDSIESINPFNQGAQERYRNSKNLNVNVEFMVGNAIQPTLELINGIVSFMKKNDIHGFELMSCQFAMHYFFQSEVALRNTFKAFSPLIKKGGYYIGTTVNGKKITGLLKQNNSYESRLLSITKKYRSITPRKAYGNEYTFKLNDSVDQGNYFNTIGESNEYLVNLQELKNIAMEYNFEPVYLNLFEQLPGKKNEYTSSSDFISFEEIYNLPRHGAWKGKSLNPDELEINNLYTTFIFIKR